MIPRRQHANAFLRGGADHLWRVTACSVGGGAAVARRATPRSSARDSVDAETDRVRLIERARLAADIDRELRVACRTEAAARREIGAIARELLRRRTYRRLGFVRLSDYARERLGVSARMLQSAAWVATRLDELPLVAAAFDRSELSWTQVRALCALAGREDQAHWLERARRCSVDELTPLIDAARGKSAGGGDPDPDDGLIDGEVPVRLRIACPARVRALWRRALDLASCVAGEPLATWRAAEIIAAEGIAGRPAGAVVGDRALVLCMRLARRARRLVTGPPAEPTDTSIRIVDSAAASLAPVVGAAANDDCTGAASLESSAERASTTLAPTIPANLIATTDPFTLDTQLTAAMHAVRSAEPRIGRLLRMIVDHQLYRVLRFPSLDGYVRERLGMSVRKAWALLKVERSTRRDPAFARAYDDGTLSWVRALTLLPVIDRQNANAWVARALTVTVRRLVDEVNWVLEARDAFGASVALAPPPLDHVLVSPVTQWLGQKTAPVQVVQIGARPQGHASVTKDGTSCRAAFEVGDADIRFIGPASVVALFRNALDAFTCPGEPRWSALERILRHVIAYWEATPRHRDPIFARDGWRCAVPGCSSRRHLHDHHLHFRSRGGGNEGENRVAVCAAHHLHGIHTGAIRAEGVAPRDIRWQLGVRSNAPPLLTYVGDRLCEDASSPQKAPLTEAKTGVYSISQ